MAAVTYFVFITICVCTTALAFDPLPMQDFCVADLKNPNTASASGVLPCKPLASVTSDDFFRSGLHIAGNTTNAYRVGLTRVGVSDVPGLNTMGVTMARLDLGPKGLFPLHTHHKATELHIVLEGCLGVGFVSSDFGNYTLYKKELRKGDMFAVPMGLVHYQVNCGNGHTSSYSIFNSQNPGLNSVSRAAFGASPAMDPGYLASAYQLDTKTIMSLQAKQWV